MKGGIYIKGDKIVCLIGESGSGKTTMAKKLEDDGYNIIYSYTTRPPREEDEWGHRFIHQKETDLNIAPENNFIAHQVLYGEHYFALPYQYQGKGISIYVIDPVGVRQLKERVDDAEIVVIYLQCDEEVRYARMLDSRAPDEVQERIEKDKKIFDVFECDYIVDSNCGVNEQYGRLLQVMRGVLDE